jgi:hypothetical protein
MKGARYHGQLNPRMAAQCCAMSFSPECVGLERPNLDCAPAKTRSWPFGAVVAISASTAPRRRSLWRHRDLVCWDTGDRIAGRCCYTSPVS